MKIAAISQLKASLSEYLAKVKTGEEVLVTDRGIPIAKIIPLEGDGLEMSADLLKLERAGLIRKGTGKLPSDFWDLCRPKDREGLALKALLKEREEAR